MKTDDLGKSMNSLLEKKLVLFKHYHLLTGRIKEAFTSGEESRLNFIISERQRYIRKMEDIDLSINRITGRDSNKPSEIPNRFRGLIHHHLERIKEILGNIAIMDRSLMVTVQEERDCVKAELSRMRNGREAAKSYRGGRRYSPRFLDTVK
jgi:hypothetical protein